MQQFVGEIAENAYRHKAAPNWGIGKEIFNKTCPLKYHLHVSRSDAVHGVLSSHKAFGDNIPAPRMGHFKVIPVARAYSYM